MWRFLRINSISSFARSTITRLHIETFTNIRDRLTFLIFNKISSINTFYTVSWVFCELFTVSIRRFVWCQYIAIVILWGINNNNIGLIIWWRIICCVCGGIVWTFIGRYCAYSIFIESISWSTLLATV